MLSEESIIDYEEEDNIIGGHFGEITLGTTSTSHPHIPDHPASHPVHITYILAHLPFILMLLRTLRGWIEI